MRTGPNRESQYREVKESWEQDLVKTKFFYYCYSSCSVLNRLTCILMNSFWSKHLWYQSLPHCGRKILNILTFDCLQHFLKHLPDLFVISNNLLNNVKSQNSVIWSPSTINLPVKVLYLPMDTITPINKNNWHVHCLMVTINVHCVQRYWHNGHDHWILPTLCPSHREIMYLFHINLDILIRMGRVFFVLWLAS